MSAWEWGEKIKRTPVLSEQQVKEIREAYGNGLAISQGTVTRLCDTILHWQAMWADAHKLSGDVLQASQRKDAWCVRRLDEKDAIIKRQEQALREDKRGELIVTRPQTVEEWQQEAAALEVSE